MKKFDISEISAETWSEIRACKSVEELKAYIASKGYEVPDDKLAAIKEAAGKLEELNLEELEKVSGGCSPICPTDCPYDCRKDQDT